MLLAADVQAAVAADGEQPLGQLLRPERAGAEPSQAYESVLDDIAGAFPATGDTLGVLYERQFVTLHDRAHPDLGGIGQADPLHGIIG